MSTRIERAVLHAAEAALAHLVMTSKMANAKLISEGTLYETIDHTLRGHNATWVNHEHKVQLGDPTAIKDSGDYKRVDFGMRHGETVTLIELVIASRTKLKTTVDVATDIEKLVRSTPLYKSEVFASVAYLIVLNIATEDAHPKTGNIQWYDYPEATDVNCIATYKYASPKFVRTAAVFRVKRG